VHRNLILETNMSRDYRNISERSPFLKGILAGVLGITVSLGMGYKSYEYERLRESKIPLAFSEIHQIEQDAINQGRVVGEGTEQTHLIEYEPQGMPRTYYLAGLNDLTMKIFECSNTAHSQEGNFYKQFAQELKLRFDSENKKHHYELVDLFEIVPQSAQKVNTQIAHFIEIEKALPGIIQSFDSAWTEKHNDNYHTEIYWSTEFYTDSKGISHTRPVMRTRSVYDDTDHSYWYYKEEGEKASTSLDSLINNFPNIYISERIILSPIVNEEGEKAVRESRKLNKDDKELTQEEIKNFVNTWYTGSTLIINELKAYPLWSNLTGFSQEWREAKNTAHDDFYKTYHHSDEGPKEYQVSKKSRNECNNLRDVLGNAIESVQFTQRNLPELQKNIFEFIESAEKNEDYKRLGKEVLAKTRELYEKNFEEGFNVDRFRAGMIFLWSLLGLVGGAGIGAGAGVVLEKRINGL